ncbi:metallophosphoesterase family protein [Methylobacterium soli]|uniref:Metallophosphoesterase n=1 Tax=Methylobacterium soli TaxID=553447 RepID=A0A6L3T2C8_9HYPH|nr:metallophosphoesterase [Methylobacterium soli]KAB1079276.1 metallophosphoesterase [Methylobacterium soli]GJE46437.1 3',5'-cyclic adenosine monophosphate phosphodiesterase CpdA [Methylobacterium soli]
MQDPESHHPPGTLSRRGALECMTWAGTGLLWSLGGGLPRAVGLTRALAAEEPPAPFTFLQISDSHVGFNKPANPDASGTLREAVAMIRQLPEKPAFIIHTGDISHLSKEQEFDDADQILRDTGVPLFFVPGEHDLLDDDQGRSYRDRFGRGTRGAGWYSFDREGVHFIGLVNVVDLKAGGLGNLGTDQLAWLERDVAGLSASTPVVVFAHIPLWTVYPEWGWGTQDGARVLACLRRFGSVTVLNGHIHQIIQKVEGNVSFHTARSTAFPQPAPGTASSPGPMKVPAGELRKVLGITRLNLIHGREPLAIIDTPLAG